MTVKKTIQFLEYLGFNLITCKDYSILLQHEKLKTEHELIFINEEDLGVQHYTEEQLKDWAIKQLEWEEKLLIVKESNL